MLVAQTKSDHRSWRGGWFTCNEILEKQKGKCFYCGRDLREENCKRTRDHMFPRAMGFGLGGNMVISCRKCNQAKGERLPTYEEIMKAWHMIYNERPHRFICEMRNNKIVFRSSQVWYYRLNFHKRKGVYHCHRVFKNNKPVLRLYN